MGIITIALLLAVLDYGIRHLREVPGPRWVGQALGVFVAFIFIAIALAAAAWLIIFIARDAGILANPATPPTVAPESFPFKMAETCYDPAIPKSVFGAVEDPGRPRQWMEYLERGAIAELEAKKEEVKTFWFLTGEFNFGLSGNTAYVYTGTTENSVVTAFLVYTDAPLRLAPLKQAGGQGPSSQYLFTVPDSHSPVRLLVFLAMKSDSYNKITQEPKFHLRSGPLTPP